MRHFRLSAEGIARHGLETELGTGAAKLIEDEGLIVGLERFAGLPCKLPDVMMQAFALAETQVQTRCVRRLLELRRSPIARAHLTHLLLWGAKQLPSAGYLTRRLIRTVSPQSEREFQALKAILTWTYSELANRPGPTAKAVTLLFCWFHTHRILLALRKTGAEPEWIETVFPRMPQRTSAEIFDRDMDSWHDVCHPSRVSWERFGLSLFGYAVGNRVEICDNSVQAALRDFAFEQIDEQLIPKLPLLVANELAENALESFFGGDTTEKLVRLLNPELGAAAAAIHEQMKIEAFLDQTRDPERRQYAWLCLVHVLGSLPLDDATRAKVKTVLQETDFLEVFSKDQRLGVFALFEASLQNLNLKDSGLSARLLNASLEIGSKIASGALSVQSEWDSLMLVETLANLSLAVASPSERTGAFAGSCPRSN